MVARRGPGNKNPRCVGAGGSLLLSRLRRSNASGGPMGRAAAPRTHQFTMSLRAFKGRTLTTLRAGLALNICSILVKGLIPL